MRISWIVPGFQSDANDRCIPALTDLAHYIAARHELTVYALQYPPRRDCYQVGSITVHSFGIASGQRFHKLKRLIALLRAVREVRKQPAHVIHAFWAAEPALVGVLAARSKRHRPRLIVSCMGGEAVYLPKIGYGAANKWLDRFYLRLAVAGADQLACGSGVLVDILAAKYKLKPEILPLGVDLARFKPAGTVRELPAQPLVLAVGSLLPVKNHASLIEAVADVPSVKLRIVGEGRERSTLTALIEKLSLQERVTLAGQIPPEEIAHEYAQADLLALPSYYESQCVALLEGMACGLPVAATRVGLAPALAQTETHPVELATDSTPAALTQALQKLLAKREIWPELRQKASLAAEDYSLAKCGEAFLEFYAKKGPIDS